jgi:hypothetical protein
MTESEFMGHFPDAVPTKRGWRGRCPAHEDHRPSLDLHLIHNSWLPFQTHLIGRNQVLHDSSKE